MKLNLLHHDYTSPMGLMQRPKLRATVAAEATRKLKKALSELWLLQKYRNQVTNFQTNLIY